MKCLGFLKYDRDFTRFYADYKLAIDGIEDEEMASGFCKHDFVEILEKSHHSFEKLFESKSKLKPIGKPTAVVEEA